MLFQEPQRTQYDFNFRIFGIPVRVHPFFWILALLLGMGSHGDDSRGLIAWMVICFASILIHELGHALAIRYFGWSPHIVLHSFGGLAIYNPSASPLQYGSRRVRNTGGVQILISLAGPAAGFLLAALVIGALAATNHQAIFYFFGEFRPVGRGDEIRNLQLLNVINDLLFVNIYWGLLNLLPIYPLDGGQVARELLLAKSNDGIRQSLMLSFITAVVIAVFALVLWKQMYMAFMFGYLAYMNYTQLSGPFGGSLGGSRRSPW